MPDISIGLAIMKELASPCGTAKSACPAPPTCQFCHFLKPSKSIIKESTLHKGLCVRSTCTQVCAKVCTHLYTGLCKGLYAQTFAQRFVRPFRKYERTFRTFKQQQRWFTKLPLRRRRGPRNSSPRLRSSRTQRKTHQRERSRESVASAWATKTVSRR